MSPAEREVMQMALETAEQIACADYRHWEELASLSEFERWARSRANHIADALRTALAQPDVPETDCGNIAQPNLVESQPIEDDLEPEQAYCPHGKVEGRYCHDCGVIEQAEMRGEL